MVNLELHELKKGNNFEEFYNKIVKFIPSLKKYTEAKLIMAERAGTLEKGFYNAEDILDDVYLNSYNNIDSDTDLKSLRKLLFDKIEQKVAQKTFVEHLSFDNIRIEDILKEELELLAEPYSRDGDGDLMPVEEFGDISYKHVQENFIESERLTDKSMERNLKEKLEIQDLSIHHDDKKSLMTELMFSTPPLTKAVIELHVFGEQTNAQIADILAIDERNVAKIISHIKARNRAIEK